MLTLEAISGQRFYRLIAERIAKRIRSGEFPVGARLPAESDLAAGLQVSRSSVREALLALELSGYVEVRVGSGVYVKGTRCSEGGNPMAAVSVAARDIAGNDRDFGTCALPATRLLVEPECAALAALNSTERQRAILERDSMRAYHAMQAHPVGIATRLREDFADSRPVGGGGRPSATNKAHPVCGSR
ncbi:FadR/GntR family transcriptional regulator [Burkholderia latens]|uniref:FadR/GntR family transcriptional regulator n=1 Tax=Burkholderia latens TaxID=488446 RepID=UPI0009EA263A|nr:GntR family transcriptional regulator [Burkholderia latens]